MFGLEGDRRGGRFLVVLLVVVMVVVGAGGVEACWMKLASIDR
jgi:hypothetical protein